MFGYTSLVRLGALNLAKSTSPEAINLMMFRSTTVSKPSSDKVSASCLTTVLKKSSMFSKVFSSYLDMSTLDISSSEMFILTLSYSLDKLPRLFGTTDSKAASGSYSFCKSLMVCNASLLRSEIPIFCCASAHNFSLTELSVFSIALRHSGICSSSYIDLWFCPSRAFTTNASA